MARLFAANIITNYQLEWAIRENIPLEGYTKKVEDNIFGNEIHPETRIEYSKGKGNELRKHMKALHSSSALVVNVFGYWRRNNRIQEIATICGASGSIIGMEFEKTHPIKGMENRIPPHLDVEFAGEIPIAIESKFTETYNRKTRRNNEDTHLDIYLDNDDIWQGIPKIKDLAESIMRQSGARTDFEYLDVPQLIKHILGLRNSYHNGFSLLYIWYKVYSEEAFRHEKELNEFKDRIDKEVDFRICTYQELFNKIRLIPTVGPSYIEYLHKRYFYTI